MDESFVARDKLCRLFVAKAVPVLENYVVYTGAMNYAWRALGATIGSKGVVLSELFGQAHLPGLVSVDDGAYVAAKVFTNALRVDARRGLAFADGVSIGKGAFVGPLSILMPGAVLEDGAATGSSAVINRRVARGRIAIGDGERPLTLAWRPEHSDACRGREWAWDLGSSSAMVVVEVVGRLVSTLAPALLLVICLYHAAQEGWCSAPSPTTASRTRFAGPCTCAGRWS